MTNRTISLFGVGATAAVAAAVLLAGTALYRSANAATTVSSGDLIRGETFSAVYYMGADGFRYVFPNDKAYGTWYANFDAVKWITDEELAEIQIGGNVTYKPGVKMIKINTDPRVYVVAKGGTLHHVDDESTASALYGTNWNTKIDDVPDGFFSNYVIDDESAGDVGFSATSATASVTGINDDKSLVAPEDIVITANGYSPIDVTIDAGQTVRFRNSDTAKHTATADDLSSGSGTLNTGDAFVRATLEAALAGSRSIILNPYGLKSDNDIFYADTDIIYSTMDAALKAIECFRKGAAEYAGIGDWTPILQFFDPYRDGKSACRMRAFLENAIQSLKHM